jgi:predicted O-methyltransferase YrrM
MKPHYSSEVGSTDAFRRVLGAYETLGFDTAAIRQWCIPELDGETLFKAIQGRRPKRILEVGTYVGVSTLLIALADAAATIVTVDPSLPLAVEMNSMGSELGSLARGVRTHDVARAAARQLGVEDCIKFVQGGFSTGDTFSSIRRSTDVQVPVVGPAVCDMYGPFDLIFVDGLHYAAAVEKDLELATKALAPGGVILMHDCIGMWGTNVRAGIFRFLADHPEFRLCHPRLSELYRSIGTIFRADEQSDLMSGFRSSEPGASVISAATNSNVSSIIRRLEPDFVIEIPAGGGSLKAILETTGGPPASIEAPILQAGGVCLDDALTEAAKAAQAASGNRLLVSFGLLDHLSDAQLHHLLGWIRDHDILAALGFTPPGEVGIAGRNSRSFPHMVRFVAGAGLSVAAFSRFDVDPVQFSFAASPNERPTTSYCIDTALVGPKKQIAKAEQKSETPILILNETQAEAFEQENLLRLHYSRGFNWVFDQISAYQADLDSHRRQLRELVARQEDLVRQISVYQAAIDERLGVESELRRQFAEQVAHSEDLSRQVVKYQAALQERERTNSQPLHQMTKPP